MVEDIVLEETDPVAELFGGAIMYVTPKDERKVVHIRMTPRHNEEADRERLTIPEYFARGLAHESEHRALGVAEGDKASRALDKFVREHGGRRNVRWVSFGPAYYQSELGKILDYEMRRKTRRLKR